MSLKWSSTVGDQVEVLGLAGAVDGVDLVDDRAVLVLGGLVDLVVVVDAVDRAVGRDGEDLEFIDLHELVGLGHGRAGHARPGSCTA